MQDSGRSLGISRRSRGMNSNMSEQLHVKMESSRPFGARTDRAEPAVVVAAPSSCSEENFFHPSDS
jgi:hypothetical protein